MAGKSLLSRQNSNSCVQCSSTPPPCACSANEQCILIEESCEACAANKCISNGSSSSGSKGVSEGAVAGAVVGSVIFLALVIAAFFYYRRRAARRREANASGESKTDEPARAEDVLNRPDPNEKPLSPVYEHSNVRVFVGSSGDVIDLGPESQGSGASVNASSTGATRPDSSNPFNDSHSIQTTSTGTQSNVIPIALVHPGTALPSSHSVHSNQATAGSELAMRPTRGADLNINLRSREAVDVQRSDAAPAGAVPNHRLSYMTTLTNGSYASDLMNEAPIIVNSTRSTVKQVVGVVKADYIRTPPGTVIPPASSAEGLLPTVATRPPVPSPLAVSSFGPSDVPGSEPGSAARTDPFDDRHSPFPDHASSTSPTPSATTFGTPQPTSLSLAEPTPSEYSETGTTPSQFAEENWVADEARRPFTQRSPGYNRPVSTQTNAGSIIAASVIGADIGSATRVNLGLRQFVGNGAPPTPSSASTGAQMTNRMTSARLVTPPTMNSATGGALAQQQQRAYQELDNRRVSMSSILSSTSTRADSILESFPFVPPSPISNRPIRSPPRSPLAQATFNSSNGSTGAAEQGTSQVAKPESPLPAPPNRKMLGLSVASQSSTLSNGLGSFPFQIDSGVRNAGSAAPPSAFAGRQRASLDTLALTSDLASYPLGFDRNSPMPPPPRP